jgi:hypothetical protein
VESSFAPGIYSQGVAQRGRRQSLSSRPSHIPGPPAATAGALPTCRLNEPIVTSPAAEEGRRPAGLRLRLRGETSDGTVRPGTAELSEPPAPRRRPARPAPPRPARPGHQATRPRGRARAGELRSLPPAFCPRLPGASI